VAALEARGAAVQRRLTVVAATSPPPAPQRATTELAGRAALTDEVELSASGAVVAAELEAAYVRLGGRSTPSRRPGAPSTCTAPRCWRSPRASTASPAPLTRSPSTTALGR
jgi:hypothetical protein